MLPPTAAPMPHSRGIRDFACAHGLSVPTVYRMIERGELVALKAGRRSIITNQHEADWLKSLPRVGGVK